MTVFLLTNSQNDWDRMRALKKVERIVEYNVYRLIYSVFILFCLQMAMRSDKRVTSVVVRAALSSWRVW